MPLMCLKSNPQRTSSHSVPLYGAGTPLRLRLPCRSHSRSSSPAPSGATCQPIDVASARLAAPPQGSVHPCSMRVQIYMARGIADVAHDVMTFFASARHPIAVVKNWTWKMGNSKGCVLGRCGAIADFLFSVTSGTGDGETTFPARSDGATGR
jgi:hypothetical protein